MLKNFFKFEKWFGVIILAAFMNMALFSYDALCAPTLSRDKAATLIQKSLSEVKTKVRLHDSGYQKGLQHGMWQTHEKSTYVTDHGAQYFQSINYSADFWGNFAAQASGSGSGSVTLKKPVNVRVKVTGIRGGSAAEFTWEYVGLPSVVKRYVVRGGNGTAQFTLYDDGWRLTNLEYKYSKEPAIQTAKEQQEDAPGPIPPRNIDSALGNPAIGKELFSGQKSFYYGGPPCGSCHRAGYIGQGTSAPDLTSIYGDSLRMELVSGLWINSGGSPSMNIYTQKYISDEEVQNIRAFLKYVWKSHGGKGGDNVDSEVP